MQILFEENSSFSIENIPMHPDPDCLKILMELPELTNSASFKRALGVF